jgi:flagellar basal-body rod protein FlgC
MFDTLDIGASGLVAQRTRMDTIANNILNAKTTRNAAGQKETFRRKLVVFAPGQANDPSKPGVHVQEIDADQSPFRKEYDPGHPDADSQGYVSYPNVDTAIEYVNAMDASRAYEANVTMMDVTKSMINASLRLIA